MRAFAAISFLAILSGCDADIHDQMFDPPKRKQTYSPFPNVIVQHDRYHSVTCWIYSGPSQGGISCLPSREIVKGGVTP